MKCPDACKVYELLGGGGGGDAEEGGVWEMGGSHLALHVSLFNFTRPVHYDKLWHGKT